MFINYPGFTILRPIDDACPGGLARPEGKGGVFGAGILVLSGNLVALGLEMSRVRPVEPTNLGVRRWFHST